MCVHRGAALDPALDAGQKQRVRLIHWHAGDAEERFQRLERTGESGFKTRPYARTPTERGEPIDLASWLIIGRSSEEDNACPELSRTEGSR